MPLTHKNIRLFSKSVFSSYKESSHEKSKISPFRNLCYSALNKEQITNSSCESQKSGYFGSHHEVLTNKVLKRVENFSFIH